MPPLPDDLLPTLAALSELDLDRARRSYLHRLAIFARTPEERAEILRDARIEASRNAYRNRAAFDREWVARSNETPVERPQKPGRKPSVPVTAEMRVEAVRLRAEGLTLAAIGARLDVSSTTISKILNPPKK